MKKMYFTVVLAIVVALTGHTSPVRSESGVWPDIGHTQWKKSEHGGNETTSQYYREIWEGAQAHKESAEALKKNSPKDDWFPDEGNQVIEKKPELSPNQGYPIRETMPDRNHSEGRSIVVPEVVSMPKSASIVIYGARGDKLAEQRISVGMAFSATQGIRATNAGVSEEVPRGSILVKNADDQNISNFVPISNGLARGEKQICDPQASAILAVSKTPAVQVKLPTPAPPVACPDGICSKFAWDPNDPRQPRANTISPRY